MMKNIQTKYVNRVQHRRVDSNNTLSEQDIKLILVPDDLFDYYCKAYKFIKHNTDYYCPKNNNKLAGRRIYNPLSGKIQYFFTNYWLRTEALRTKAKKLLNFINNNATKIPNIYEAIQKQQESIDKYLFGKDIYKNPTLKELENVDEEYYL